MRVMHWREKADVFCGFTLLPSVYVLIVNGPIILQKLLFQGKWLRAGKFNFCT